MNDLRRRYLRLNRGDRRLAAQAVLVLPLAIVAQRLLGFKRCRSLLGMVAAILHAICPVHRAGGEYGLVPRNVATRTTEVVRAVVLYGPFRANCLQRSMTLWCLLRAQGVEGELRVGVQKASGRFEAHAWVEYRGAVLNDADDVRQRFAPFVRPLIPQRAVAS